MARPRNAGYSGMAQHSSFCNWSSRRSIAGTGVYGRCVLGDRARPNANHDIQYTLYTLGSTEKTDLDQCDLSMDLLVCVWLGIGHLFTLLFLDMGKCIAPY